MRSRRLRHSRHPRRRRRRCLRHPCHFISPCTATSCPHRRRQVSPPLTARLVFSSCRWCGGDALPVPTHRLVTALLPPRRRCGARHV
eukprot:scaffold93056_cov60-Phaeocystis_antarctica.AAC.1